MSQTNTGQLDYFVRVTRVAGDPEWTHRLEVVCRQTMARGRGKGSRRGVVATAYCNGSDEYAAWCAGCRVAPKYHANTVEDERGNVIGQAVSSGFPEG